MHARFGIALIGEAICAARTTQPPLSLLTPLPPEKQLPDLGSAVPETFEAVEREEIGVVVVMGTALAIVESGATSRDDVVAIEKPVHVLEAVGNHIRMIKKDAPHRPMHQVG
jgi:hypothetical protein